MNKRHTQKRGHETKEQAAKLRFPGYTQTVKRSILKIFTLEAF